MTPKQFADQYCQKEGYKDFADFYMTVSTCEELEETVAGMMQAYALSVLPGTRDDYPTYNPPKYNPLKAAMDAMTEGWNDCIDQIEKNIMKQ